MKDRSGIWGDIICAGVIGWLITYILLGHPMSSYTLEKTQQQNWIFSLCVLGVLSIVILWFGRKNRKLFHLAVTGFVFCASVLTLFIRQDGFEALGFAIVLGMVIYFFREDISWVIDKISITDTCLKRLYICLGVLLFLFLTLVGVLRYVVYFSPGHDLGIFAQMYEYMLTTGKQLTTVERDELLSHFSIHISPIYYLLLPVYFVFQNAATLQVCQAFIIALSIWPIYLLCRHFKLSNKLTLAIGICYVCYPALSGGCFNDFHENCFLPLLLLFLIYALEKNKKILFYVCMILALFVKEDVAIQLIVLSLYFVISGKNKIKGWIMMAISSLYLCVALWMLSNGYEGGVLNYMSNLYLTENGGILEVIKTVIMNPGYAVRQIFAVPEKIQYIGWIILPLIAAVVIRKNYVHYILFLYWIFMNLLPAYGALNDIYFQYHYPAIAFLFYFVIMNAVDWRKKEKVNKIPVMLGISIFLFCVSVFQSGLYIGIETIQGRDTIKKLNTAIELIPEEASVRASSLLIPHLTNNKVLYGFYVDQETDYIIIDYRPKAETEYEYIEDWMDIENYEEIYFESDVVKLYKKK